MGQGQRGREGRPQCDFSSGNAARAEVPTAQPLSAAPRGSGPGQGDPGVSSRCRGLERRASRTLPPATAARCGWLGSERHSRRRNSGEPRLPGHPLLYVHNARRSYNTEVTGASAFPKCRWELAACSWCIRTNIYFF